MFFLSKSELNVSEKSAKKLLNRLKSRSIYRKGKLSSNISFCNKNLTSVVQEERSTIFSFLSLVKFFQLFFTFELDVIVDSMT